MFHDNHEERQQWLAGLEPGSTVAVRISPYGTSGYQYRKAVIKYITPKRTRFDLVDYNVSFDRNGDHHIRGRFSSGESIVPYTEEIRESILYRVALNRCEGAKWGNLPKDVVMKVSALLKALPAEGEEKKKVA